MNTLSVETPAAPAATSTARLRIIGVGKPGISIVEMLQREGGGDAGLVAVDLEEQPLAASTVPTRLRLETRRLQGLGSGGDPERARAAAEEHLSSLTDACRGAEVVLIVTGLGGGAGTGMSPVIARAAKDCGALVLACVVTPFECEGTRRMRQAQAGLEQLRLAVDGVICLPNQKVLKMIQPDTSIVDTFRAANELVVRGVRGLLDLLTRRGLIPIHLNDLCALLRGRHMESALASAEACGPNRAAEVVERILAHPMLEDGRMLTTAESVVVSISGGPELSMADVNGLMEKLTGSCAGAQVLMGAAVDETLRDRLGITLIATHRAERGGGGASEEVSGTAACERSPGGEADEAPVPQTTALGRGRSRFGASAPMLPLEDMDSVPGRQSTAASRPRKGTPLRQGTLQLDVVPRGRFAKTEPNIHRGEDLDTPTYLRRGLVLN